MSNLGVTQFFNLINGGDYNQMFRFDSTPPDINIVFSDTRIEIRGSFVLDGDLVFTRIMKFEKELFFDGGVYRNIIFLGGSFPKITFRRGQYNGFVSIRGGEFKNLLLLGGSFNHWLGTMDGIINNQADEKLVIHRFEIEGGTYVNNMWISGGDIDSLEIKCVTPVKIHCKPNDDKIFDPNQNKYLQRYNSTPRINNLIISRYSNKENFYHISSLALKTIEFENYTNIGNITISKVKLTDSISVQNSDLGKTTFIDCDFSQQKMYFDSSKINEIALAGSFLPIGANIISKEGKLLQKKLALSQIKKVYQSMGDSVSAAQYQSEELETYMQTLKFGWEKVNLWFNSKSNRHGQSWGRALIVLLVTSAVFYTFYCSALGFHLDLSRNGVITFFRNFEYFLEFINPIRKSDFIPKALIGLKEENLIPAGAIIVDSCSKICNAYLIYQLIAAFRKHGKKSD